MNNSNKIMLKATALLIFPLYVGADTIIRGDMINTPSTSMASQNIYDPLSGDFSIFMLVAVCLIYFLSLLYARYVWIVKPNNTYLRAYADEVRAQLEIEQDNPGVKTKAETTVIAEIEKLLTQLEEMVPKKVKWRHWLLSGTGKQMAGWRHVHKAKVFATGLFSDSDACAEAIVTSKNLSEIKSETAKELTSQIDHALNADTKDISVVKSLTKRGQELLFDKRDNYFEGLANWQNRATWLVFVSLFILVVAGITNGNTVLFVVGAIGGLLSRMRKVLIGKKHAFDYGASWSTLFLAPVVGALTGWSGVLLVLVLADADVLGAIFGNMLELEKIKDIPWRDIAITKASMALALVFGFSATFFERVIEGFENKTQSKTTDTTSDNQSNTQ
ncbi:MAG TPA: hypothetical protein ENI97_02645 [Gammaproteobacteria bacterium]|nr:hypothetical protein [Gammaproteobacteria bacterium]